MLPCYKYTPDNPRGLRCQAISCLYCDNENIVWTGGDLLNCIIPGNQNINIQKTGPYNSSVYSVVEDKGADGKKQIWIGSWYGGGLFKTDENFKNPEYLKNIPPLYANPNSMQVNEIIKDHTGAIWVAPWMG